MSSWWSQRREGYSKGERDRLTVSDWGKMREVVWLGERIEEGF